MIRRVVVLLAVILAAVWLTTIAVAAARAVGHAPEFLPR